MDALDELTDRNRQTLERLESNLGYAFRERSLLQLALVHRSYAFEQPQRLEHDNERLEYIGDAVLDLAVAQTLYRRYPEMREGEMTRLRALLVKESHLAEMAAKIGLGEFLFLGRGEEGSRGREKPSILASAYEAVVGAMFEDGGYEPSSSFIDRQFDEALEVQRMTLEQADAKSRLQEVFQETYSEAPTYSLEKSEGPDHSKTFTVAVCFRGLVLARGVARSKKEAEQRAAAQALKNLPDLGLAAS